MIFFIYILFISGITEKINDNYFNQLGVDAIWLSPFVEQNYDATDEGTGVTYAYHGYWTRDWTALEPNFGNTDDLTEMIQTAHQKGIRIVMDAVLNHTGPVTPIDFKWPKEWVRTHPTCNFQDYNGTTSCTLVENLPDIRTESQNEVELPIFLVEKWKKEGRYEQEVNELNAFFERTKHPRTPSYYIVKWLTDYIKDYGINRDIPSVEGTSKLSPYIKHGQIHVGTIWTKCSEIKSKGIGYRKYVNELGWREFSHSLINYFPEFLKGNYRKEFDKFPWVKNEKFLKAWKSGMTGYPIVDAGMRELYETGWMHNRIRMVVGSFLVKHLRINWTEGEKHFRNCLLDFNKANNVAQWQWVAGCGADAAPYFRIFNPILQGEKFDKEGKYVKKWIPELSKVPQKFIHKPWEMETKYQEAINTIIGKNYPKPIVVHEEARAAALKAFQSLKKN